MKTKSPETQEVGDDQILYLEDNMGDNEILEHRKNPNNREKTRSEDEGSQNQTNNQHDTAGNKSVLKLDSEEDDLTFTDSPEQGKSSATTSDDEDEITFVDDPEESDKMGLPPGWRRNVNLRLKGKSKGEIDIYYYTPGGKRLRSRPEVPKN